MKKFLLVIGFCLFYYSIYTAKSQDLRSILDSQINQEVISIPKGTYVLDLKNGKNAYVFSNKKNVIVEGNGSTIICNRQNQAFQFTNCENMIFRNLTIEYDPPCSSQGTITEVAGDKRTWTVEIHGGYPTTALETGRILAYDKNTRELKQNMGTLSTPIINTIQTSPTTKVRFTINEFANNSIAVGDYVAFVVYAEGNTQAHTMIIADCKYMKFENIAIYDSNCFSFYEYNCEKNHYYRCVATRKKDDPKYAVDRLRAGAADAFHSKFATIGPIVEECKLEYTGDDCIAINGNFYPVYATNKSEKSISFLTTSNSLSNVYVKLNDKFVCVNNDGSIRGRSVVGALQSTTPTAAERTATFNKLSSVRNAETFVYGVKVFLDTWIEGSATGDVIYSDDRIGRGFKVLRDTVGGNRSRAILLKSSEGIVDGCVIRGSAMSGIALAPEFYWMEAGCPNNVIIRNNTIDNCMFDANMSWTSQFAALVVVSQAPNGQFAPAGSLNNISIYNNTITNCPYPAVGITSTNGVYFANNSMTPSSWTRNHGSSFGVTNTRDLYRVNVANFSTTIDVNDIPIITGSKNDKDLTLVLDNGMITISGMDVCENIETTIYSSLGKKVHYTTQYPIYVQGLEKGIYCVTFKINNRFVSSKIAL